MKCVDCGGEFNRDCTTCVNAVLAQLEEGRRLVIEKHKEEAWAKRRTEPFTERGISRAKCIRCGERASHQWSICADGNSFRPICVECDIALNDSTLRFMRCPEEVIERLMRDYRRKLKP